MVIRVLSSCNHGLEVKDENKEELQAFIAQTTEFSEQCSTALQHGCSLQ